MAASKQRPDPRKVQPVGHAENEFLAHDDMI